MSPTEDFTFHRARHDFRKNERATHGIENTRA